MCLVLLLIKRSNYLIKLDQIKYLVIKFTCIITHSLPVSYNIGKGGSRIRSMEDDTGCRIKVSSATKLLCTMTYLPVTRMYMYTKIL